MNGHEHAGMRGQEQHQKCARGLLGGRADRLMRIDQDRNDDPETHDRRLEPVEDEQQEHVPSPEQDADQRQEIGRDHDQHGGLLEFCQDAHAIVTAFAFRPAA
jgi:hypothetical protein